MSSVTGLAADRPIRGVLAARFSKHDQPKFLGIATTHGAHAAGERIRSRGNATSAVTRATSTPNSVLAAVNALPIASACSASIWDTYRIAVSSVAARRAIPPCVKEVAARRGLKVLGARGHCPIWTSL